MSDEEGDFELIGVQIVTSTADVTSFDAKETSAADAKETKAREVRPSIEVTPSNASGVASNTSGVPSNASGVPAIVNSTVRIPNVSFPSVSVSGSFGPNCEEIADVCLETTAVRRTTIVWIVHGYSMIMHGLFSDEFTPLGQDGDIWRLGVHPLKEMKSGGRSETEINVDLIAVKLREPVRVAYRIYLDANQQGSIRHHAVKRDVSFRTADSTNQWLHTKTVDSIKFTNPNAIDGLLQTRVLDDIRITMDLFYLDD